MGDTSKFSERLRGLMGAAPVAQIAKSTGIGETTLRHYLDKGGMPSIDKALNLAEYFGVAVGWLVSGEGDVRPSVEKSEYTCLDDTVLVPVLREVHASAGLGVFVDTDGPIECIRIPRTILPNGLRQELSMIFVDGDSMEPTLRPGEPIIVNRAIKEFFGTGIYIVRWDGCVYVKRLDKEPDGTLHIISDNGVYHEYLLQPEATARIEILGKVVMKWRLL